MVGVTTEGMSHHILSYVKMMLNARINVLVHFIPQH